MKMKDAIRRYREVLGYLARKEYMEVKDETLTSNREKDGVEIETFDAVPPTKKPLESHKANIIDIYA